MLTYELKKTPAIPLYEALYRCIRRDILSGKLEAGTKLPSKRALAAHLEISKITVEAAYNQLAAEGYICPREKVGYYVESVETFTAACTPSLPAEAGSSSTELDLTANVPASFPFSVWSRLQRQVLLDFGHDLLQPLPSCGCLALRQAIADHLSGFRGMQVDPENIIIGAGTDFLYNLVPQLLGLQKTYALEDPGYQKIQQIYTAAGVKTIPASMDGQGVLPESLTHAQVLHFSPSHHFPTGIVTPMGRRQQLLKWAAQGNWIVEDDYDCEFRFDTHPMAALYGQSDRVIYINSFSKSMAPSIRMGYMVLPPQLMGVFREKLGFYTSTVSGFEQHTLARFLSQGYFEKHLNRMRKFYRLRRNQLLEMISNCPRKNILTIEEADAGLHFLLKVNTTLSDEALEDYCAQKGLRVHTLSHYYRSTVADDRRHCLVINYSGLQDEDMATFSKILGEI